MLAALSRPQDNKCPEALQVIADMRAKNYGSDPIVGPILQENEAICALVNAGKTVPTATSPAETPLPGTTPAYATPTLPSLNIPVASPTY